MTRREILEKTISTVCHDRNNQYGEPEDNFSIIAQLWEVYINHKALVSDRGIVVLSAEDVANMMCLFKEGRIITGTAKEDSYIDLAGYAACAGEIATKKLTGGEECKTDLNFLKKFSQNL